MSELLNGQAGERRLFLGNEAIVRGALEAGVSLAAQYPGTPSSEIGDRFYEISRQTDLIFEYSVNEKVALEVAAGASAAGWRALAAMKHVGLNVAADVLVTLAYVGVKGGLVIITADDPSLFSSQNEQDNRYYARLAALPMLEPASPQEAKDMAKAAFALSEELGLPVLLRTTTRINHTRGPVTLGELPTHRGKGHFVKDPFSLVMVPAVAREAHARLLDKQEQVRERAEISPFNTITGARPLGPGHQRGGRGLRGRRHPGAGYKGQGHPPQAGFHLPLAGKTPGRFPGTGGESPGGGGTGAHFGGQP